MFKYEVVDLNVLRQRAEIAEIYSKYSLRTVNEIRAMDDKTKVSSTRYQHNDAGILYRNSSYAPFEE